MMSYLSETAMIEQINTGVEALTSLRNTQRTY